MENKLFVIGLDAATLDIINPLVEKGLLPFFKSFYKNGVWGELTSTLHPLSPPAWTSFITGKNPGKHGIYDFVVHKPNSYELEYTYGGMRKGLSIWKILSIAGKRVVVLNVPMTFPPESVNGILISGFDSPGTDSDFAYPPSILKEITRNVGEYQLRDYPQGHNPDSFLKHIESLFDFRIKLTHYMMDNYEWDFFMMVFGELDVVQHAYWQYTDPAFRTISIKEREKYGHIIQGMYIKMDSVLSELVSKLPQETTILIMSDHGAGPCYKAVFINKWLEEKGLLSYEVSKRRNYYLEIIKQLHHLIKTTMPPAGLEWLKRRFPRLRQKVKSRIVFSDINWAKTKVWSFGRESTNLFINLKGRFPNGTVNPGSEYENLREWLIKELKNIVDTDTNEPAVDKVYRGEEVYNGDCIENAPDLLVTWRNHQYTSWPGYRDRERSLFEPSLYHSDYSDWSKLQKGGNHRPNGILFMKGENIKKGYKLEGARIIDLAPTILYLMGTSIPSDMDGKILKDAIISSYINNNPPQYTEPPSDLKAEISRPFTEEEASLIEERLRGLGYIE
ncbi:MAG: alkaline phosphatase family protein [Thermodesulfovibrionales bacterium]